MEEETEDFLICPKRESIDALLLKFSIWSTDEDIGWA